LTISDFYTGLMTGKSQTTPDRSFGSRWCEGVAKQTPENFEGVAKLI
jgi:hypothetical protein